MRNMLGKLHILKRELAIVLTSSGQHNFSWFSVKTLLLVKPILYLYIYKYTYAEYTQ